MSEKLIFPTSKKVKISKKMTEPLLTYLSLGKQKGRIWDALLSIRDFWEKNRKIPVSELKTRIF
jgi:hypothetical protein